MMLWRSLRAGTVLVALTACPAEALAKKSAKADKVPDAPPLTAEAINGASLPKPEVEAKPTQDAKLRKAAVERPDPVMIKAQVLLDRARFFPGAIDGRDGDNVRRALSAFAVAQGLPAGATLTPEVAEKLGGTSDKPVVQDYTITQGDADGPYLDRIPPKMEAQADLDGLGYTSAREMLAERFHMQRDLLAALNPGKSFDKAGTVILVAAVDPMETGKPSAKDRQAEPKVERIEVDKTSRGVRALGADGKLVAYYPASIGSTEKPAPSGTTKVTGVAYDPTYTYNPKYAFRGVKTDKTFSIKAGPNNPVGVVWIDLDIPSYGIHGTPEPEKVGKTESHGCIRLTNWNARDLALHVTRGATVAFKDD